MLGKSKPPWWWNRRKWDFIEIHDRQPYVASIPAARKPQGRDNRVAYVHTAARIEKSLQVIAQWGHCLTLCMRGSIVHRPWKF